MTSMSRTADSLAAHAVCAAAGVRDGLRAAQFYVRDLSNADRFAKGEPGRAPFLSRAVAQGARLVDRLHELECQPRHPPLPAQLAEAALALHTRHHA